MHPSQPVSIDIKPGRDSISIDLKFGDIVPVVVLITGDFDATTVDRAVVVFAGAMPLRWIQKDMDGDGDLDLLFFFKTLELNLEKTAMKQP